MAGCPAGLAWEASCWAALEAGCQCTCCSTLQSAAGCSLRRCGASGGKGKGGGRGKRGKGGVRWKGESSGCREGGGRDGRLRGGGATDELEGTLSPGVEPLQMPQARTQTAPNRS
eukprot:353454-Chlamydomonas_euryale.AAC.1